MGRVGGQGLAVAVALHDHALPRDGAGQLEDLSGVGGVADELTELVRHCTLKEDDANKVERRVGKSAAALLLVSRSGEQFDVIATGASEKGT
jgi:exoribonuclease R